MAESSELEDIIAKGLREQSDPPSPPSPPRKKKLRKSSITILPMDDVPDEYEDEDDDDWDDEDYYEEAEASDTDFIELPESVILNVDDKTCPWLNDYIDFSRKWSPRAYDDFHEACGLWLLSTIAARRLVTHLGKPRHTHLYIILVARTSLYAKSTTAEIAVQVLRKIGLGHLLMPDTATPQRFISIMAEPSVEVEGTEILFSAGQRGWVYEEFGQQVAAMMKPSGIMHDFLFMLRRFDDDKDYFSYSTIGRKDEIINEPYLALLANLTPADLRPFAKRGSVLWGDGFLGRFALVCPPEATERCKDPFPPGRRRVPLPVSKPLVEWNEHLGNDGITMKMTKDVRSAYEEYDNALLDLLEKLPNQDLDGNYAKLSERTLRAAVLLASVSGEDTISMKYWAKAQGITERWRADVHELYFQINQRLSPSLEMAKKVEERILKAVWRHPGATAASVYNVVKANYLTMSMVADCLTILVGSGILVSKPGRSGVPKYWFPTEDDVDDVEE